jgi:hypothetical protein
MPARARRFPGFRARVSPWPRRLPSLRIDVPTVLAMSALAYTLSNLAHEGLGHGGTCVLVGAHPTVLNAIFFEYDDPAASVLQQKWISAGGSIADVLVGLPALWLSRQPALAPSWRYFLWLFAAVNLLTAFGYLLYSGIAGNRRLGARRPWSSARPCCCAAACR